ncbi:hypothetical protein ACFSTD_02970 [Novosphingobium colocasiae]
MAIIVVAPRHHGGRNDQLAGDVVGTLRGGWRGQHDGERGQQLTQH